MVEWFGHENWGVPTGGVRDLYMHVQLSFCPSDTYTGQLGSSWAQVPKKRCGVFVVDDDVVVVVVVVVVDDDVVVIVGGDDVIVGGDDIVDVDDSVVVADDDDDDDVVVVVVEEVPLAEFM